MHAGLRLMANLVLTTRQMANLLGFKDTDRVSQLCKQGRIPGAFRTCDNGNWRIRAEDFRAYLLSRNAPTQEVDRLLKAGKSA